MLLQHLAISLVVRHLVCGSRPSTAVYKPVIPEQQALRSEVE
jgi:hypothetical protein